MAEPSTLNGVKCTRLTVKAKIGTFEFWFDEANRTRKIEVYRGAFDEYFGKPLWKLGLSRQEATLRNEPDQGERSTFQRETYIYSDYGDEAEGVSLPHQIDSSIERRDPSGQMHKTTSNGSLDSLEIRSAPFPESETALDVPDGTIAYRSPIDGVPREWRDGKVVTVIDHDAVKEMDRLVEPAVSTRSHVRINWRYFATAVSLATIFAVLVLIRLSRHRKHSG